MDRELWAGGQKERVPHMQYLKLPPSAIKTTVSNLATWKIQETLIVSDASDVMCLTQTTPVVGIRTLHPQIRPLWCCVMQTRSRVFREVLIIASVGGPRR